jgi:hypothetical protein
MVNIWMLFNYILYNLYELNNIIFALVLIILNEF